MWVNHFLDHLLTLLYIQKALFWPTLNPDVAVFMVKSLNPSNCLNMNSPAFVLYILKGLAYEPGHWGCWLIPPVIGYALGGIGVLLTGGIWSLIWGLGGNLGGNSAMSNLIYLFDSIIIPVSTNYYFFISALNIQFVKFDHYFNCFFVNILYVFSFILFHITR